MYSGFLHRSNSSLQTTIVIRAADAVVDELNRIPGANQVRRIDFNVSNQEPRLNLNTPRLQLPASLVVDQAPVVVGKSSHPPQPAQTAWYTVRFCRSGGASVYVFIRKRPAEVGSVCQVCGIRRQDTQPKSLPSVLSWNAPSVVGSPLVVDWDA